MENWQGKVALVTGASSGIGASIAIKLVSKGMKVVGCGRKVSALDAIAKEANASGPGHMVPVECDVEKESNILDMFRMIEEKFAAVHVLVNNAGLAHESPLLTGETEDWNQMMAVNVMAPCICSREAVKLMDKAGIDDGYIININSTSGHAVDNRSEAHFYQMTKFAITAMTDGIRRELISRKSHIRVTSISPGMVRTDFLNRWFQGDTKRAEEVYSRFVEMPANDIAEMVVFALSSPPTANICELLVRATEEH